MLSTLLSYLSLFVYFLFGQYLPLYYVHPHGGGLYIEINDQRDIVQQHVTVFLSLEINSRKTKTKNSQFSSTSYFQHYCFVSLSDPNSVVWWLARELKRERKRWNFGTINNTPSALPRTEDPEPVALRLGCLKTTRLSSL